MRIYYHFAASLFAAIFVLSLACGPKSQSNAGEFVFQDVGGQFKKVDGSGNPLAEPCLRMTPSGVIELPGIASGAPWDKYNYLVFDVVHEAGISGAIRLKFTEQGDTKPSFNVRLGVMPRLRTRLVFPLSALDAQQVFLPRTPGRLKAVLIGRRTRPELIDQVTITLDSLVADQQLYVAGMKLTTDEPSYPLDGPPVIDSLGQWTMKDWPGKTGSVAELKTELEEGLAEVAGSRFPDDWSKYGGWKKLRFDATGFFRVEKTDKRWWLVDPEGCAFFSAGVDGISPLHAGCPLDGIEPLFAWIPAKESEFAPVWSQFWGQYWMCDFAGANLIRAFGGDWRGKWGELSRGRLVKWRFNTLGNWTDREVTDSFGLPYVIPLREFPSTGKMIYRDFPDVFDPAYTAAADKFGAQLERYRDDPLMIGYFLANEPQWAFGNELPASAILETGERSTTRDSLAAWLSARYGENIKALNAAWKSEFTSFDALKEGAIRQAGALSERSREDLNEFSKKMVVRYLEPVCDAVSKVDPNHLNLGIRWAGLGSDYTKLGGKYCDVFTVNMYRMIPDTTVLREISEAVDKPVMIGEYHFGATDRGLPSTGLRGVADQTERGVAYRAYVECAAAQPYMVGTHYFIWNDQPAFGRFDGENYNIGLVDVCNKPYYEFVEAAAVTHERMYPVAAGQEEPFDQMAETIPRVGF